VGDTSFLIGDEVIFVDRLAKTYSAAFQEDR